MIQVNLIPTNRRRARQYRTQMRYWIVICGSYCVVILVVFAILRTGHAGDSRTHAGELEGVTEQIQKTNHAIALLRPELAAAQRMLEVTEAVTQQPNWSLFLALLAHQLHGEIVLHGCTLEPDNAAAATQEDLNLDSNDGRIGHEQDSFIFRVDGMGRTQATVSQFVLRLERCGLFSQVTLVNTQRQQMWDTDVFRFQLACKLGGRGLPGDAPIASAGYQEDKTR